MCKTILSILIVIFYSIGYVYAGCACKNGQCSTTDQILSGYSIPSLNPYIKPDNIQVVGDIKLKIASTPEKLIRLKGPTYYAHCAMCLGNILVGNFGISKDYLETIGYQQWQVLYDNIHNDPKFIKHLNKITTEQSLFEPTPLDVILEILRLTKPTKSDILYDLGCGDGRVVIATSKIYKCRTVGVDIDDLLLDNAKENIKLNNVEKLATVFNYDVVAAVKNPQSRFLQEATIVYIYLMPELNAKLSTYLLKMLPGARIISHNHLIPGIKFDKAYQITSNEDKQKHTIYIKTIPEHKLKGDYL